MPATAVNSIFFTGGAIMATTRHSGSFLSENGGASWQNISKSIPYGWQYKIVKNPLTSTVYLLHQNGTFKTTYGNWDNWTNTNFFGNTMGFNSQGHGFLFSGAFCYKTTNDGSTFQSINIGNISYVRQVTFDVSDNIYIATANDFGNNGNGVWESSNGALSWQPINTNLPLNITAITSLTYQGPGVSDCEREIIAASSDGRGFSLNSNLSWNEFTLGFSTSQFIKDVTTYSFIDGFDISFLTENELKYHLGPGINTACTWYTEMEVTEIDVAKDVVATGGFSFNKTSKVNLPTDLVNYLGTLGAGICTVELSTGVEDLKTSIPSEYALSQNYPNPLNPSTTIELSIPEQTFVNLEVFNTLGEKVTTLVSDVLSAGNYKYNWSGVNLPTGVYMYRLQTNNFSESKKMLLLK